ncbi:hypothetical protein [Microbacterium sp. CCH5-D1]|uniref:hypothetical protein n=1 Tax=Microbacterium sp. CCH5-D1 TaxID=1768780 RepID=UPI00076AC41A|nr:hypothetical protein [Microbacterium sp. CCH5-D1]
MGALNDPETLQFTCDKLERVSDLRCVNYGTTARRHAEMVYKRECLFRREDPAFPLCESSGVNEL